MANMPDRTEVTALGKQVKRHREKKGLTQVELSKAIGMNDAYVNQLECGRQEEPGANVAIRLAKALGVSLETLMGTDDAPNNHELSATKPRGSYRNGPTGTLKDVTDQLVTAVGGQRVAANLSGRVQPDISKFIDPANSRYMPIDVVARLESDLGRALIGEQLVARNGGLVVYPDLRGMELAEGAAQIATENGELIAEIFAALSDGKTTRAEAGALLNRIDAQRQLLLSIRQPLQQIAEGADDE